MTGRQASYAFAVLLLAALTLLLISLPALRTTEAPESAAQVPFAETDLPDFHPTHALSLRALQAGLASRQGRPRHGSDLAEMNVIDGLTIEADGEILLLGRSAPTLPRLAIHDLAVALRNAYATGPTYSGVPGCTIDPQEGSPDPFAIQEVKVFGIPHNSPMAARFVAVDYEMKRVSAGIVSLRPDLRSFHELHRLQNLSCSDESGETRVISSVHRFWFCAKLPDSPRYWEDDGVIWIRKPVHVQLLTERAYLDATGRSVGKAPAEPAAEEFARSVSEVLLGDEVPRYVQLRNDFRLIELAQILHHKQVSPEELGYFLYQYEVPSEAVPSYVGEVRRKEQGEVVCESHVWKEDRVTPTLRRRERILRYEHLSQGGVRAEVPVHSPDFRSEALPVLAEVRRRALASRPSTDEFIWVIRY